jgi:hypothetical protein
MVRRLLFGLLFLSLNFVPGVVSALNIQVRDTFTNQVVANGSTVDIGDVAVNFINQRVFNITNLENYSVQLTACSIPFPGPFSIGSCPAITGPATLFPGLASSMSVRLLSATPGTFTATVYGEAGLFNFNIKGRVLESSPSISVETAAGVVINKNQAFNFGSTPTNTALEQTFRIRNLGAQALTVNTSVAGDGYLLSIPPAPSVAAGGETMFKVRLYSLAAGTFTGNVSIANNDPGDNPFNFGLSGSVTATTSPLIRIVDTTNGQQVSKNGLVNYGPTTVNNQVTHHFTIYNDGNATLSISSPIVSGPGFTLTTQPPSTIAAAGGNGGFDVRFLSSSAGTFNGSISISNNVPNNNPFTFNLTAAAALQPAPRIRVTIDGGAPLAFNSIYDFGTTLVNQQVEQTFRIWNDGDATLTLGSLRGGGTGFVVPLYPPSSINAGSSGTFKVRFTAPYAGNFFSQYSFSTNDPSYSNFTLNFAGAVLGPKIRIVAGGGTTIVNGGIYNYPNTLAGAVESRAFTIYNDGTETLTISNYALNTAGGFSTVIPPPSSIAPGGSGVFRIRLLSSTPGQYSALVSFNTNDLSKNPFSFELRGTVVPAGPAPVIRIGSCSGITVANGSLYTFSSTTVSSPISCLFTIYNDGDATLTISNPATLVSGTGWSLILVPPSSIAPGASGVFRVRLLSATAGTYTGSVTIQNNSASNPFSYSLRGTVN